MADQESSIRLTAKADIADAIGYARAIDETTAAIRRHIDAVKDAAAVGIQVGGSHGTSGTGGAATGSAPPTPAAAAPGPGGAVAPAPATTGGSAPAAAAQPVTGGAATGQAPAPPAVVAASGAAAASPAFNFPAQATQQGAPPATPNQSRAMAAVAGHAPAAVAARVGGFDSYSFDPSAGSQREFRRQLMDQYGGPDKDKSHGMGGRAASQGMSFLSHATSTAIGVGLGTSLSGFLLAAPQRYLALSEAITTVGRKFREADENATRFGGSLGYTIARTAQLADTLGRETNTVDRGQFQRMAGFARFTGMDPGAAMRGFGTIERLSGGPMTDPAMVQLLKTAQARGMDQGRLEEFLGDLTESIQGQFATTGRGTMQQGLATQGIQNIVYGEGDPRRSGDKSFLGGLQATMTGSDAMKSYMMRAMGYGTKGGPGYIEAKIRTDAGLHDSRNVIDLFESFQRRGMGTGAQFRALESVSGGNLNAQQLQALVTTLGTKEGLNRYRQIAGAADEGGSMKAFMAMLDPSSKAAFEKGGFGKLGEKFVSEGESIDVRIERMMMTVGKPIAEAIPPLQNAIESIAGTMQNLTGVDWGTLIPGIARSVERMAKFAEDMSSGGDWKGADGALGIDSSQAIGGRIGKVRYLHDQEGVSWLDAYNLLRTKGEAGLDTLIESRMQARRDAALREMGTSGGGQ